MVFSTLNQEVQKVVGEINVISGELDHIENYKTDVVEKIDGLTEISQNNAASTEETAATIISWRRSWRIADRLPHS